MSSSRPQWKNVQEFLEDISDLPEFVERPIPHVNSFGNFGNSPLKVAAVRGDTRAIQLLISAGAEINAINEDGETALHHAISQNHFEAAQLLLELGASTEIKNSFNMNPFEQISLFHGIDSRIVALATKIQPNKTLQLTPRS